MAWTVTTVESSASGTYDVDMSAASEVWINVQNGCDELNFINLSAPQRAIAFWEVGAYTGGEAPSGLVKINAYGGSGVRILASASIQQDSTPFVLEVLFYPGSRLTWSWRGVTPEVGGIGW